MLPFDKSALSNRSFVFEAAVDKAANGQSEYTLQIILNVVEPRLPLVVPLLLLHDERFDDDRPDPRDREMQLQSHANSKPSKNPIAESRRPDVEEIS